MGPVLLTVKGASVELVGLFGSGCGDKFWCLSGVLDCLGPAVLTGKGVSTGRVGLFGSGHGDKFLAI